MALYIYDINALVLNHYIKLINTRNFFLNLPELLKLFCISKHLSKTISKVIYCEYFADDKNIFHLFNSQKILCMCLCYNYSDHDSILVNIPNKVLTYAEYGFHREYENHEYYMYPDHALILSVINIDTLLENALLNSNDDVYFWSLCDKVESECTSITTLDKTITAFILTIEQGLDTYFFRECIGILGNILEKVSHISLNEYTLKFLNLLKIKNQINV